ncbi:CheA signal transduction histidine kinase [Mizugakiibacter sediminis]|uniref:Chemotaxis protein CheA n=1 Tax=Mizugakiibacter sediminis TaxID=1475481 RepID=A0A0K8QJZ6_9GAMM|nr:Hpt domain-containing protein [Mizugakiibacter sediminis]GAP65163.1 CheA signal transduction histidine kinase [Mizugakiibacter sediminis]
MRLEEDIDFTTLNWVKAELDETLKQARQALETYVEDPADASLMRFCATYLHQVQGTLRMVELYGAAMVVEEMERLAQALLDDQVRQRDEAYGVLMRGMVQMPDYLERLQSGHKDIPIVLLPLLNDLRACRGEKLLSENVLFTPNLKAPLPPDVPGAATPADAATLKREVAALRVRFQPALLGWFRGQGDAAAHLAQMRGVLDGVTALCHTLPPRRMAWVAGGVLEALEHGRLTADSSALKQLVGRVDRALRQLGERGEDALADADGEELVRNLLYYAAQATPASGRVAQIRRTYRLDQLLPSEKEIEHARGSISGHNRALLDTVAHAIKEDLLRVKESLDIFLRQRDEDPSRLGAQAELLDRVGDTLGMLGLGVPRRVVGEQRRIVEEIATRVRPADEGTLLDVAGALLYVEASLDDHIDRLGASVENTGEAETLPKAEARKILEALMREAAQNLGKVKEDIVAFIESPWDHARVEQIPRLLEEIAGALRMLDVDRPADLLAGIGRFVDNELIIDRRIPTAEQMDKLADALASIEYYLEAAREHRGGRDRILEVTQQSLAALGYWPVPPRREATTPPEVPAASGDFPQWGDSLPQGRSASLRPSDAGAADDSLDLSGLELQRRADGEDAAPFEPVSIAPGRGIEDLVVGEAHTPGPYAEPLRGLKLAETEPTAPPADAGHDDWIEIEEEVEEDVPVEAELAAHAGFETASGEIDAEIREVFVEEVQEEIENLRRHLPAWTSDPEDLEALKPVRRSFHTLKGSGRLVGALTLGEFSWKVENMLNRVLDGTIAPNEDVRALVGHAVDALPGLLAALRGEGAPSAPLASIMSVADRLAAGESARVEQVAAPRTQKVKRIVKRRVPRPRAQAAEIPTATLAGVAGADFAAPAAASAAAVLPPVDPLLLDILRSEVGQHLGSVRAYLAQCATEAPAVGEPLLRAVHTLNGAIAMVDIPVIGHVLAPLESYLKRLRALETAPGADGVAVLREAADLVDHVMAQFDAERPELPASDALAARIAALRDALPEPTVAHVFYEPEAANEEANEEAAPPPADDETATGADSMALPEAGAADEDLTAALMAALDDTAASGETPAEHGIGLDLGEFADFGEAIVLSSSPADAPPAEEPSATEAADDASAQQAAVMPAPDAVIDALDLAASAAQEGSVAETPPAAVTAAPAEEAPAAPVAAARPAVPFPDDPHPEGPLDLPDLDTDLLEIFVQEGTDILDHSDTLMAKLREAPHQRELVGGLQRDLHTLKGGARMAGLAPIGDLAHAMETLLEQIGEGRRQADPLVVESLERGFDRLHGMVQRVAHGRAIAMPDNAIARFEALAEGRPLEAPAAMAPVPPAAAEAPAPQPAAEAKPAAQRPAPRPAPEPFEEPARAPQEMIRVRSELLDSLVNYAGEVSIYRSRLEQQISTFRFNLVEFEQTVSRLREQLRKLEIETEAQILSRYQREHEAGRDSTFDPLELDRFSQLQQLSRALAESVSDLVSIQGLLDDLTRQSETLLLQQSRVSSDLQEGLMRTRMVPFDSLVPSLRRTLRQAAQEVGKHAQLRVEGAQGEMDRNLLERMKAPFEHMLRNALAHGIETPAERRAAGKPEEGTVVIRVSREATEVVIRVSDDGRGFDRDAIRRKAIERGLMKPDAQLSDRDLFGFVLETGFSTAESVTQLAGRGVGMDVVHSEIKQLGGTLAIDSERGRGTTFTIRLPFTLAVTQAILVRLGETTYAIPMSSVQGVVRIARDDLDRRLAEADPSYTYAGETFAIHDLAQLLGVPAAHLGDETQLPLLMTRTGDQRAAVRIDAVIGSREVVVKSVGPQVSSVPGIFGATIMGDGSVVMILDLAPLVRRSAALRERAEVEGVALEPALPQAPAVTQPRRQPLVMVVDDSITMRKVTGRVLERHDIEVVTAKDGLDAVEKLQERVPDLMLLDIEMPRMDGYELATYMKNDPRLKDVPIIMVTSRTGEKHRQRAMEIGVERYLGKPYQEMDLVREVQAALKASRV